MKPAHASRFRSAFLTTLLVALTGAARAGDLAFSDPRKVPAPPANAIGFPSRDPDLDALPGFQSPPPGYGEVAFYWWLGDPLTRERLAWQIEQLDRAKGVMGLQINYAHGTHGGLSYGSTLPSDPPLFSEAWWNLVDWFLHEAKRRGMAISLSDYTLGIGQGWSVDEVLKQDPDLAGSVLEAQTRDFGAGDVKWQLPPGTLMVAAYRLEGDTLTPGTAIDLRTDVVDGVLRWHAPSPRHRLVAVAAHRVRPSLDPMNPHSGPAYANRFFGPFEKRFPGEAGAGLNFFFSDELGFGVGGNLWTARFAEEFHKRKGYDLVPELPALFHDVGPRTPKVRLDYSDVKVALTEEGFFQPCFAWHQQRGMIFGCDHGGRGRDVVEFGDYFRTQRWNQGPGSDQPSLGRDLIKAKVASSIAHLYQRPRVWIEGYYGSGWGTTTAQLTDATIANFAHGYNLLTLHGLYYSTHGGFWEWAPPCNHFRMPYWAHMREYLACVQRLSYLLSQGVHRCDVAIVYPVAPMEAGLGGKESVEAAFQAGSALYEKGIDFDFIDFESLERAEVAGSRLEVSGESYRVLVLPALRAARWSTLQRALEFQRAGGTVVVLGALPEASDRAGRDDPELNNLVSQLTTRVDRPDRLAPLVEKVGPRDFTLLTPTKGPIAFLHRKIGQRDVFLVYGAPRNVECAFRATGAVELWDPWTGQTRPLPVLEQTAATTRLSLPLTETEAQVIVFRPGQPVIAGAPRTEEPSTRIALDGDWEFTLEPTLDNRFGDYHWPPTPTFIGAEARQFRYADETTPAPGWQAPDLDDASWSHATCSFGPNFWKLGPLPAEGDSQALEKTLMAIDQVEPTEPVEVGTRKVRWIPYEFSWRFGVEGDPGYQGYHGLKERLYDAYIRLGKLVVTGTATTREAEPEGTRYYLWTSVVAPAADEYRVLHGGLEPAAAWLNGVALDPSAHQAELRQGVNTLLLRYDRPGAGHFTFVTRQSAQKDSAPPNGAVPEEGLTLGSLAMRWYGDPTVLRFDVRPRVAHPAGWYRFESAPGLRALEVVAHGALTAWADGTSCEVRPGERSEDGARAYRVVVASPSPQPVQVALRIEQERGLYGGAALPEPMRQECGTGELAAGDWSRVEGLRCYSGGAWYRKTVALGPEQVDRTLTLDLGQVVASAEVRVNGQPAGIRVTPPWRFDISRLVQPGENRIEVLVYNTLANHYVTIPTRYRGELTSGLLGPVTLVVAAAESPTLVP